MTTHQIFPGLLALALLAGGALLMLQVFRERRKMIAARIAFVAPSSLTVDATASSEARADAALLRVSVRGLRDSDLAEIARVCHVVGIRPHHAQAAFAATRLVAGAILALVALLVLDSMKPAGAFMSVVRMTIAPAMVAIGWMVPLIVVRRLSKRRAASVSSGLPEALELLVVCVEAGLALEDGLDRITVEIQATQPALADELEITSADLKVLPERDEAFRKLSLRVDSPSIRSVVATLSQTLRYGTPLSGALRVAAAELRNDSLIALEERANRLPTLMTLPMMLFIMPTIFLIVGGPVVLRLIDVFSHRH